MSTTKPEAAKPQPHEPDWAAIDALTDDEIAAQIAADLDAAPDMSEWPSDQLTVMDRVDVKAIRDKLEMTQREFADAFQVKLTALREWEQRRRVPRGTARVLLQIIDREPAAVRRALRTEA